MKDWLMKIFALKKPVIQQIRLHVNDVIHSAHKQITLKLFIWPVII